MTGIPSKLASKLLLRQQSGAFRKLLVSKNLIDFSSNDYLGFSKSKVIFERSHRELISRNLILNGSTGSRLLTGNSDLAEETERRISKFHKAESALIFNSGYDANLGFFSSVPQRHDVILYDELCHASIRDGINLSNAKSFKFGHNDIEGLSRLLEKFSVEGTDVFVITESVFSMDGDSPPLEKIVEICIQKKAFLIVDEAHALGIFGEKGSGLLQLLGLENEVFARLVTFGKGLGSHGAAILGSAELRNYLVNFARSFIYTTALPAHSLSVICAAYDELESSEEVKKLRHNIGIFNQIKKSMSLQPLFVYSKSAIQSCIVSGNEKVKNLSQSLGEKGFDVRAILSPTVPLGQERLRICLHSFNTEEEIQMLLVAISQLIF